VTHIAASVGGITWCLLDYRFDKKWSVVGFCSGAVAGLVAITPGSGFVPPWSAVVIGILAGIGCNFGTKIKFLVRVDDALDIFSVHAIGGLIGNICTGLFAANYIAHLDGYTVISGGWVNQNYIQLGYQLAGSCAGFFYAFGMTCALLFVMNLIPGLSLRATGDEEELGIDDSMLGEFAYDYVEVVRQIGTAPGGDEINGGTAEKGMA